MSATEILKTEATLILKYLLIELKAVSLSETPTVLVLSDKLKALFDAEIGNCDTFGGVYYCVLIAVENEVVRRFINGDIK